VLESAAAFFDDCVASFFGDDGRFVGMGDRVSEYHECAFDNVKPNGVADVESKFSGHKPNFFSGDVRQYELICIVLISCVYGDESF